MGEDAPTGRHRPQVRPVPGASAACSIGLSVYQIEFDFGVPQFRQVFEPMLIAAAAAFALVAARIMLGRGAALIAALLAIGLRGGVALIVGPRTRRADQLVRAVPRARHGRRAARADAAAQAAVVFGARQRPRRRAPSGSGWSRCGSTPSTTTRGRPASGRKRWRWPCRSPSSSAPAARWSGMVLTEQRLPRRAIGIGLVALTVLAIGGADGQRPALRRARKRHGHNHSHRRAQQRRPASWRRPTCSSPRPNLVSDDPNWVSVLGWQGGLANERGDVRRPSREGRPGPLPLHRADAGVRARGRRCCGVHDGRHVDRRADLSRAATPASARRRCPPRRR